MMRFSGLRFQKMTPQNAQQQSLEIGSAMSLLRMCYRSIDICVKPRHGRTFLKKRLIESWRENRAEPNTHKQRFLMERGGAFLQTLHTSRTPNASTVVVFQLSRVEAQRQKEIAKLDTKGTVTSTMPK